MICVFLREREFGCVCLWEGGGCTWFLFKVNRTLRASRGSGVSHSKWGEPDSLLPFGGSWVLSGVLTGRRLTWLQHGCRWLWGSSWLRSSSPIPRQEPLQRDASLPQASLTHLSVHSTVFTSETQAVDTPPSAIQLPLPTAPHCLTVLYCPRSAFWYPTHYHLLPIVIF